MFLSLSLLFSPFSRSAHSFTLLSFDYFVVLTLCFPLYSSNTHLFRLEACISVPFFSFFCSRFSHVRFPTCGGPSWCKPVPNTHHLALCALLAPLAKQYLYLFFSFYFFFSFALSSRLSRCLFQSILHSIPAHPFFFSFAIFPFLSLFHFYFF